MNIKTALVIGVIAATPGTVALLILNHIVEKNSAPVREYLRNRPDYGKIMFGQPSMN